jgi:hypothetical protein
VSPRRNSAAWAEAADVVHREGPDAGRPRPGSSRTSLHEPPSARGQVRARLPAIARPGVLNLEKAI